MKPSKFQKYFAKDRRFSNTNPLAERLCSLTLKAILNCKNHPSRNANNNFHFHFNEVSVKKVYKEIRK